MSSRQPGARCGADGLLDALRLPVRKAAADRLKTPLPLPLPLPSPAERISSELPT